jgi:hypothetical protein
LTMLSMYVCVLHLLTSSSFLCIGFGLRTYGKLATPIRSIQPRSIIWRLFHTWICW